MRKTAVLLMSSPTAAVTTLEMQVAEPLYPSVAILPLFPTDGDPEPMHSTSTCDGESIARTLKPSTKGSSESIDVPRCAVEIFVRWEI
jgi:hypothetical protein